MRNEEYREQGFMYNLVDWQQKHPYLFAFIVSAVVLTYTLFRTPSLKILNEDMRPIENIQFINIDEIKAQKRVVKKEFSAEQSDVVEDSKNVERATGTSDDADAVDLAFHPNIAQPRLIGGFKKNHPKIAKELDVEASVNVALLIAANGKVKDVKILRIALSKDLPQEVHKKIKDSFYTLVLKDMKNARYIPTIIDGKSVPVKVDDIVYYRLR
jgi:hypothetical protein